MAIFILGLTSCGGADALPEALPTPGEMAAYREKHTDEEYEEYAAGVVRLIAGMSDDEIAAGLREALSQWIDGQKLIEVTDTEIGCWTTLGMNPMYNQKWFRQSEVDVSIYYDESRINGDEGQLIDQFFKEMVAAVSDTTLGGLKLASVNMYCYGRDSDRSRNERHWEYSYTNNFSEFYDSIDWQPSYERAAQKIAYDFASGIEAELFSGKKYDDNANRGQLDFPEIYLSRFGRYPGSPDLNIEFVCVSKPEDGDALVDSVGERCRQLYDALMADEDARMYFAENRVTGVTIYFDMRWAPYDVPGFYFKCLKE